MKQKRYLKIYIGKTTREQREALKDWLVENNMFFEDVLLDERNDEDILKAQTLLRLVESHKKHCKDKNCNISLILMKELYENYIGRPVSNKEFEIFI